MKRILTAFFLWFISITLFADSGIYICGYFRRERPATVSALRASGYTFGILFNVHVEKNGDLTTDGETICKDGVYVFDKKQPYYVDDVNALVMGKTSILRLEHCIGGWGNYAYQNISNLVKEQGTGPNSILYRNFKALKDAIPVVEAINNDIEHEYEADTQSQFHVMLYDIGFKTTIAPYMNKSYWDSFVAKVNAARPGAVERNYLQCYGGGGGNNPKEWNIANLPIYGSRDIEANSYTHKTIVQTMTNWKNDAGIVGGFYWNYNASRNLKAEAAPINEVFGSGEISYHDRIVAMVYPVKDYMNPQTNFTLGTYTSDMIKEKGFNPSDLAAIKIEKGVKLILYTGKDNTGEAFTVADDVADISTIIGDKKINSWTVIGDRIDALDGKEFVIKNTNSGYYLKPSQNSATTRLSLQMKVADSSDFMFWTFEAVGNGLYKIVNKGSGLVMQVKSSVVNTTQTIYEGVAFEQNTYTGDESQHFIVTYDDVEKAYKLKVLNSLKYAGLANGKEGAVNSVVVQRKLYAAQGTSWSLEDPASIGIETLEGDNSIKIYPRLVEDILYIESESSEMFNVKVVSLNGAKVMEESAVKRQIDLSQLPSGVYCLTLEGRDKVAQFKIIKK